MTSTADRPSSTRTWTTSVRDDTGPIVLAGLRTTWAPLAKQTLIAALVVGAAVASTFSPWLLVTAAPWMWTGVLIAVVGLVVAAAAARWPAVMRIELVVPAMDFFAVGLLRYGTGDSRSVFTTIVALPLIWVAANPGRWNVLWPVLGTAGTLLLPYLIAPTDAQGSELVRLFTVVVVFGATAAVTNELARQAGLQLAAVQRRRRVAEGEIDRAALVQQSLLPTTAAGLPEELRAVGVCIPARTVGGDFYDWFPTPGGAAFTLGDVMGKGVGAGMIAAAVRSLIRSTVDESDPAVAVRRAATGLATGTSDLTSGQFTTCFHVRVDRDGHARWVDAGHGLTVLRSSDGTVRSLRSGHLPIGVGTAWTAEDTFLEPGDVIVTVSDGVLDLFGGDLDSLDRFEAWVAERDHPQQVVDGIAELAHAGDHPDDVTVLCIGYRP
ncbi:PP2C family protein-serine/threonine phosphatase [Curtobacterium sp. TXMA1]|uniref:PP2C family protein-serine/threonine phosphatase n=1 Tax=Curtobacterium sp. TXMA1 TaxID=2876939 RepID=UPI001CCF3CAF|nr:PP2C family protein-serine/threonine phosphatase [Curtobacterium sp. TXMA1]UBQ03886.1 serine/threonine-protein phosphatase [Curtobacterium sp. TXMA1]